MIYFARLQSLKKIKENLGLRIIPKETNASFALFKADFKYSWIASIIQQLVFGRKFQFMSTHWLSSILK